MTRDSIAILASMFIAAAFLVIGARAARRTHNAADLVIAHRRLNVWFTALGYSANVLNAWMLLVMGGAAYVYGASAVWLWAAVMSGAAISLFYVSPRLRIAAAGQGAFTVTQMVSADAGDRMQPIVVRSIVFIVMTMLLLQIAVLLRAAGEVLVEGFGFSAMLSTFASVATLAVCLIGGGMRAAAALEAVQSVVMLVAALALAVVAYAVIGGAEPLRTALAAVDPAWTDVFGGKKGVVAIAFAAGGLGIGLAMCGQPQALNRFIAARDDATVRAVRWAALGWIALLLGAVLVCGWGTNLLYSDLERPEHALFVVATRPLPPWLSATFVLAILAAVVTALAGPLLAITTSLAVDLRRPGSLLSAAWVRSSVVVAAALAIAAGVWSSAGVIDHFVFAYTTLGAALGPLVLVRLSGKRIRPGSTLGAVWSAFILSLLFHLLPDSPGDFLERVLPFVAALGIALTGGERRRNPDRADRAQETVHDRIPI